MEVDLTRLHGLPELIAKAARGFERKFVEFALTPPPLHSYNPSSVERFLPKV
jgi:hypothetical protein